MLTRGQFQHSGAISEGAVQPHGWGSHGSEITGFCNLTKAKLYVTYLNNPKTSKRVLLLYLRLVPLKKLSCCFKITF